MEDALILLLVVNIFFAAMTHSMAKKKGYDPRIAAIAGFFLTIIAAIWYYLQPQRTKKRRT